MHINKNDQKNIKAIFYIKTQVLKEHYFKISSTIKDIFDYFENNIKEEGYSLKSQYKIYGKTINELYTISDLINTEKNDKIIKGEIWIEVENKIIFDDENDETFYKILQPNINPFELIEFNSLKSKIKIIECPQDIFDFCKLNTFTKESAFCNSNNALYISGGEFLGNPINNFWIINKNNYKINRKLMPINKQYHSMLYIPDNYIFIVGGHSLNTIIYDIENQEFINWACMNIIHYQPGLLIYGDYVYSFSALNDIDNNNNIFEKTNLTIKTPKWEIIYPKYANNIKFNCYFFGISKCTEENILFIGGEKNNPGYIYNPIDNVISLSNGNNPSLPFWDKSFYKISEKYNIGIPLNFNSTYTFAVLNKETKDLEEIKCNKNTGYYIFNFNESQSELGNIYIHSTIKSFKGRKNVEIQIGRRPMIEEDTKNESNDNNEYTDDDKNNFDTNNNNEQILVVNYYDKKENLNSLESNKKYQKKKYFYLPDYIIDDQIINREVNLNGNLNGQRIFQNNNNETETHNSNNNNEGDIVKEELIFSEYLNENNNDDNPINKNPRIYQKQNLYIPNTVIDDQIMNRELINKDENIKKNIELETPEKKDEIIGEGDTIIIEYNEIAPKNEDTKMKINDKKCKFLYVPNSTIDDQIIDREIDYKVSLKNKENSNSSLSIGPEREKNEIIDDYALRENEIIDYTKSKGEEIKAKKHQNIMKIYIPNYAIDDQIINRQVSKDGKKK